MNELIKFFRSFAELWYIKAPLAVVAALLQIEPKLIGLLLMLLTLDFLTGIYAAKKRGENITSYGFRRTVVKGLIYAAFCMAWNAFGNAEGSDLPGRAAVLFCSMTELKSITENVWAERSGEVWGKFKAVLKIFGRGTPPESEEKRSEEPRLPG